jgi:hypothetical protein
MMLFNHMFFNLCNLNFNAIIDKIYKNLLRLKIN